MKKLISKTFKFLICISLLISFVGALAVPFSLAAETTTKTATNTSSKKPDTQPTPDTKKLLKEAKEYRDNFVKEMDQTKAEAIKKIKDNYNNSVKSLTDTYNMTIKRLDAEIATSQRIISTTQQSTADEQSKQSLINAENKRIEEAQKKKKEAADQLENKTHDLGVKAESDLEKIEAEYQKELKKINSEYDKETEKILWQQAIEKERDKFNVGLILKAEGQKTFFEKSEESKKPVIIEIIDWITTFLLKLAIPLAVLAIVIGGYKIMLAGGDENSQNAGKELIKLTVIGLVIIFSSFLIVQFVISILYQR